MSTYEDTKHIAEKIKESLRIEDVLSSYISIKRAGKNYTALCPFHAEDSPSFYIFPDTKTYHCFGCGAHGDIISFIKEYEKIKYMDALEKAANLAGIKFDFEKKKVPDEIRLNEEVSKFYTNTLMNLPKHHMVWNYLNDRKISLNEIKEFEIGFSHGNEVGRALKESMFDSRIAFNAGLLRDNIEYFRNRLIIPIRDNHGQLVGFSGRSVDGTQPKYINTQETEFFKKSHILYGFYKTSNYIKQNEFGILVEGYFDAISLYKSGFRNVTAVLGSSLTKEHVMDLSKVTSRIITMFDMDDAGTKATLGSIDLLAAKGFQIAVAKYDAKDPDELVKKSEPQYIAELLKQSYKFHEYIADAYSDKYDLKNDFGLEDYLKQMSIWYKKFVTFKRYEIVDSFLEKIAIITGKSVDLIRNVIINKFTNVKIPKDSINETQQNHQTLEKEIRYDFDKSYIYLWLKYPEYRKFLQEFNYNVLPETPVKEFLGRVRQGDELSHILEEASDDLNDIITEMWKVDDYYEPDRILAELKKTIKRFEIDKTVNDLKAKLKDITNPIERAKITKEIIDNLSKTKRQGGSWHDTN